MLHLNTKEIVDVFTLVVEFISAGDVSVVMFKVRECYVNFVCCVVVIAKVERSFLHWQIHSIDVRFYFL